jgi:hypothetical protein
MVRYDLLLLSTYALGFIGTYLLARELGVGVPGAIVAGAAFAYAPFRLEQEGHMQVLSSGGIPLALALGLRGFRLRRPGWMLAGWLVAAWQLTLGFTLGIPLGYLFGVLALIAGAIWLHRGRPTLDRRLAAAAVAGAAIFAAVAALLALPYLRVGNDHPNATREPGEVTGFSGPAKVFLVAPEENWVWGGATAGLRDDLLNVPEKTLFPGAVIVLLALGGLGPSRYSRGLRFGLAAGVVGVSVLALGFQAGQGLVWPYRWLYDFLPGWDAIRAPGRLVTFSSLGLALLAAMGAERAIRALARRAPGRREPAIALGVSTALALAIAIEGMGLPLNPTANRAQPRVPSIPPSVARVAAPQLHLPALRPEDNRRYLLWSTDGFPKIVNGRSSFNPPFTQRLIERVEGFPDERTVRILERLGVRTVVLHTDRTANTPWADAARRSVARLGISRQRRGPLLIYALRSPSAASRSPNEPSS